MTKSKQATFYQRIISASHFMTRKSEPQTFETVHCDDDQVTLCEKPKVVYEYDVDQSTLYEENDAKWSCLEEEEDDDEDEEEEDYMNEILSSYASTLDKLSGTETIPKQTRNTAVLIVLSPNALTAGTIARQRRKSQKSMCNAS
ncbi:hypothetical protein G6F56_002424 [Rhizopus delemar]|nr:hypothetical protein G6F56_002424 [Rhizopus delemar]